MSKATKPLDLESKPVKEPQEPKSPFYRDPVTGVMVRREPHRYHGDFDESEASGLIDD